MILILIDIDRWDQDLLYRGTKYSTIGYGVVTPRNICYKNSLVIITLSLFLYVFFMSTTFYEIQAKFRYGMIFEFLLF